MLILIRGKVGERKKYCLTLLHLCKLSFPPIKTLFKTRMHEYSVIGCVRLGTGWLPVVNVKCTLYLSLKCRNSARFLYSNT